MVRQERGTIRVAVVAGRKDDRERRDWTRRASIIFRFSTPLGLSRRRHRLTYKVERPATFKSLLVPYFCARPP